MNKTPFETMLEQALEERGYRLSEPIYRQDLLLGVQADEILEPPKRNGLEEAAAFLGIEAPTEEDRVVLERLVPIFTYRQEDFDIVTSGQCTVKRRIADSPSGLYRVWYDLLLDYAPKLDTATSRQLEQRIRRALQKRSLLEAVHVNHRWDSSKDLLLSAVPLGSFSLAVGDDEDDDDDDDELPYDPRRMTELVTNALEGTQGWEP
jgi:hypothetical protein